MLRIGIDLGGTKIEVIAIGAGGETLVRRRVPTPAGDYGATVGAIVELVRSVERELGERGTLGIGTPGALSQRTGRIKNSNSTVLIGKPLRDDLQAALGRTVNMENDANCFALSEALDGAARGARVVFGAILGTGVGGGIVIDGNVIGGANAIAGEWGHNPLPWPRDDERPGPRCYCGKHACLETFLCGPGLAADYGDTTARATEIAERAEAGEAAAHAALGRYEDRLARGLASVINVLDPDTIVLGGGVSQIARLYRNVPELLPRYVFSDAVVTRVVQAMHGDSSGVRGAAML